MKRIRILTYSIDLLTLSKQFLELIIQTKEPKILSQKVD